MVQPLYDFVQGKCMAFYDGAAWSKNIKESFMNSKFYKVLVDAGLLKAKPLENEESKEENS